MVRVVKIPGQRGHGHVLCEIFPKRVYALQFHLDLHAVCGIANFEFQ